MRSWEESGDEDNRFLNLCPQNVGYVFGSSTRGQRSLYDTGLTGIPITNCNNNCSTGSTALFLSRNLVAGGMADCALALGFEKMQKGSLAVDDDDVNPLGMYQYYAVSLYTYHIDGKFGNELGWKSAITKLKSLCLYVR